MEGCFWYGQIPWRQCVFPGENSKTLTPYVLIGRCRVWGAGWGCCNCGLLLRESPTHHSSSPPSSLRKNGQLSSRWFALPSPQSTSSVGVVGSDMDVGAKVDCVFVLLLLTLTTLAEDEAAAAIDAAEAPVVVLRRWAKSPRKRAAYPRLTLILWQSWCANALRFNRSSKRASISLESLSPTSGSGDAEVPLAAFVATVPPPRKRLNNEGSDVDREVVFGNALPTLLGLLLAGGGADNFSFGRSRSQKRWNLERGFGLQDSTGKTALGFCWVLADDTLFTIGSGVVCLQQKQRRAKSD